MKDGETAVLPSPHHLVLEASWKLHSSLDKQLLRNVAESSSCNKTPLRFVRRESLASSSVALVQLLLLLLSTPHNSAGWPLEDD